MLKVAYIKNAYPERRCIINKVKEVKYINFTILNFTRIYNKFIKILRLDKLKKEDFICTLFIDINFKGKLIYHFFNDIILNSKNSYVVTYETLVPRVEYLSNIVHFSNKEVIDSLFLKNSTKLEKILEKLAEDNCKKLIALSNCNNEIQKYMLNFYPKYRDKIEKKMLVLPPPQKIIVNNYSEKNLNKEITFTFVGRDFFRKGGYEIVKTFEKIFQQNSNIKLNLVGEIDNIYNYAFKNFQDSNEKIKEIKNIIEKNKKNIFYYEVLSNEEVVSLMKNSHVGLLPTWADTYGYSVLEFQACACPVITTDLRALPEINSNEIGWLIEVPKNMFKELALENGQHKDRIRKIIQKSLYEYILEIVNNPDIIETKGKKSLQRIKREHSIEMYSKKLENIYFG